MAEWVRPATLSRAIGVLALRNGKVSFSEHVGEADWELSLATITRVAASDGGTSFSITSSGQKFAVTILDADMVPQPAKPTVASIARAIDLANAGR